MLTWCSFAVAALGRGWVGCSPPCSAPCWCTAWKQWEREAGESKQPDTAWCFPHCMKPPHLSLSLTAVQASEGRLRSSFVIWVRESDCRLMLSMSAFWILSELADGGEKKTTIIPLVVLCFFLIFFYTSLFCGLLSLSIRGSEGARVGNGSTLVAVVRLV